MLVLTQTVLFPPTLVVGAKLQTHHLSSF